MTDAIKEAGKLARKKEGEGREVAGQDEQIASREG
jgi:hypothetical protein